MMQYPILVYGSLRPTFHNYAYLLDGNTVDESNVRLSGFEMRGASGYPYVLRGVNDITATLIHLQVNRYNKVMRDLDILEGFRGVGNTENHYQRILHSFELDGEHVEAWMYIADGCWGEEIAMTFPSIPSGDWKKHVASQ